LAPQSQPPLAIFVLAVSVGCGTVGSAAADSCSERCPVPLGMNDPVTATQSQLCLANCRRGVLGGGDSYAAVAISETTYRAGVAYGEPSREQAERNAVASCRQNNGGADCKSVHWVANSCVGIAISRDDKAYGVSGPENSRLAAWHSALEYCRKFGGRHCSVMATPCSKDDSRRASALPLPPPRAGLKIDPQLVGEWFIDMNPGRWIWEIGSGGTYQFHSEAPDLAPTHAGLISAADGKWTLNATAGVADSDGGTYQILGRDKVTMTGKLGTATWRRVQ